MPSTESGPGSDGGTLIRRTTTSDSGKVPWLPLIIAAAVVPLLLTALATVTGIGERDDIEGDLGQRSEQALTAAGIDGAKVDFEGRDGTISGVAAGMADKAADTVRAVDGVRVAEVEGSGGNGGSAGSNKDSSAIQKEASAAAGERSVDNQLSVDEKAVDKDALQAKIDKALQQRPIDFEPDTVKLTSPGAKTVAQVAELLRSEDAAKVRVEGHVAKAAGSESEARSLSERRAKAVAKRLTAAGVDGERVSAKGLGSTKPVKSNKTPEGQAANRRVEIVVL